MPWFVSVPEGRSLTGVAPPVTYDLDDLIQEYLCGMRELPSFEKSIGGTKYFNSDDLQQLGRLGKWIKPRN